MSRGRGARTAASWLLARAACVAVVISTASTAESHEIGATQVTVHRRGRVALVFVFGLLHGMGFAGALSGLGLPGGDSPRLSLASISGWNAVSCW